MSPRLAITALLVFATHAVSHAGDDPFAVTTPPPGLPSYYAKYMSVDGYPILASAKVSDYALKEAAYWVRQMLGHQPKLREAMIKSGSHLCILAWSEFTTDLPEFSKLTPKDYWDARARGTGGSDTDPYCSCAEENLLCYPGDPYPKESILIHEFAHNIHLRGMVNIDPAFDARVHAAYDSAMKAGLWKGKYASVNANEYFAVGVQSWFGHERFNDHDHNHVHTRAQLLEYDPALAALCREVFGDEAIQFTKPLTRLSGHLAGYDPSNAPTFDWPERLVKLRSQIRSKAELREKLANSSSGIERDSRNMEGWMVNIDKRLLEENRKAATDKALALLNEQLKNIVRVVPANAVAHLQQIPLWISPEYPGIGPRAEYHPDAFWLRENGRDPIMAKGVEFTNVRIFQAECNRMPWFVLHELAHSYHDQVLGFDEKGISKAYHDAKESKVYDRVERWNGNGRPNTWERAYAMTNDREYFAESTEAFFGRNDFYPFTRDELKKVDPGMDRLLVQAWGVTE